MLTVLPDKAAAYAIDPYYREAEHALARALGGDPAPGVARHALLVPQAELYVGRRVDALFEFLDRHDLVPVAAQPLTFTRRAIRELWRYRWSAAPLAKLALADRRNRFVPTMALLLRDTSDAALPASVRLTTLKGGSDPRTRPPHSLRQILASPNRMMSFVHTADEPADVVRELGVCFPGPAVEPLAAAMAHDGPSAVDAHALAKALEAAAPEGGLDATASWARLIGASSGSARERLAALRRHAAAGALDHEAFAALAFGDGLDPWDAIVAWSASIEHLRPGAVAPFGFGDAEIARWRAAVPAERQRAEVVGR